jgi:hypothetical protein
MGLSSCGRMAKRWIMVVVSVTAVSLPDGLLFRLDEYPRAPYDVVYRERDSLMAVTCMNGYVSI